MLTWSVVSSDHRARFLNMSPLLSLSWVSAGRCPKQLADGRSPWVGGAQRCPCFADGKQRLRGTRWLPGEDAGSQGQCPVSHQSVPRALAFSLTICCHRCGCRVLRMQRAPLVQHPELPWLDTAGCPTLLLNLSWKGHARACICSDGPPLPAGAPSLPVVCTTSCWPLHV